MATTQTFICKFSKDGEGHTHLIDAPTAQDAKRILYTKLGVKRLVGVNIQNLDSEVGRYLLAQDKVAS